MSDLTNFYTKNILTVRNIARDLLCLQEGEIMTSIAEYTETFGVSRWTIQTAIQYLLENKCMTVEKHGPNGTNVYNMDRDKLWKLADLEPFIGIVPPAVTDIHESLYTGITMNLGETEVPFIMGYMVPAGVRVESLLSGRSNFVLMSKLSADILKKSNDAITIPITLDGALYSKPFELFARKGAEPEIKDGTVVGIYEESVDVKYITELLCEGKKVIYKKSNYHGCANMLKMGEIDVVVQRRDINDYFHCNYECRDLHDLGLDKDICTPVFVCNKNDYGVDNILKHFTDVKMIKKIQEDVLTGKRMVSYY